MRREGLSDRFLAVLPAPAPPDLPPSTWPLHKFAIRFATPYCEWWDNNGGCDYHLRVLDGELESVVSPAANKPILLSQQRFFHASSSEGA